MTHSCARMGVSVGCVHGDHVLHTQLLPTKLYSSKKTHTCCSEDVKCRLCGHAKESVSHILILSGCTALAQNKYLIRHKRSCSMRSYVTKVFSRKYRSGTRQ